MQNLTLNIGSLIPFLPLVHQRLKAESAFLCILPNCYSDTSAYIQSKLHSLLEPFSLHARVSCYSGGIFVYVLFAVHLNFGQPHQHCHLSTNGLPFATQLNDELHTALFLIHLWKSELLQINKVLSRF